MDGWIDGWMGGGKDKWINGLDNINILIDRRMDLMNGLNEKFQQGRPFVSNFVHNTQRLDSV